MDNATPRFAVLDAPSILGLRSTGVDELPRALRDAGLLAGLAAEDAGIVPPLPYDPAREQATNVLNPGGIRDYSCRLASALQPLLDAGRFPVVLGGDCSIVIGATLALRRRGRHGLVFIDGHADFYSPESSPTGEVADMDLAIVAGHGPDILTNIDGLRPLVPPEDIALVGYRDAAEAAANGSPDVRQAGIAAWEPEQVRALGMEQTAAQALAIAGRPDLASFWVHLDADVLDDAVMPAVDYRLPGGLSLPQLSTLLNALVRAGAAGLSVAIYNPRLDPDGTIGRRFTAALLAGLTTEPAQGDSLSG
jgi:arginase